MKPVRAALTLTMPTAPSSSARADVREADAALVAGQRHRASARRAGAGRARSSTAIGSSIARTPRSTSAGSRAQRLLVAPAAVRVDVELGVGQRVADRADAATSSSALAPDLDLEGPDAEALVHLQRLLGHAAGSAKRDHVRDRDAVREPAEQRAHGRPSSWPTRSQTARSTAPRATRSPGAPPRRASTSSVAQRVEPLERRPEPVADRGDDRGLRLAVGVRPRLRLGLADEAVVGVHAHEHVVRRSTAPEANRPGTR